MNSPNQSPKRTTFRLDRHDAIITEKLKGFCARNEFFDTVLKDGDNNVSFQAHRVVLCAFSEYFLEKFRDSESETASLDVEIKEIGASQMKIIIEFMYSGVIDLGLETVEATLRAALFLKINPLVECCCKFIGENIDSGNSLIWFRLAHELNLPTLKATARESTYNNFEEISTQMGLLQLSENELKDLLFNDNPYGDFEEDVFCGIVAWINYDKSNRKHLAFQLLSMVRFHALTPEFIVKYRNSVDQSMEHYELISTWLQWHLLPKTRSNDPQILPLQRRMNKKKQTKLAVVTGFSSGKLVIETFNKKVNLFCTEIETQIPIPKTFFLSIVIEDKLIIVESLECGKTIQYFDLQTWVWTDQPMKPDRNIWKMLNLKGHLCIYGIECGLSYRFYMEVYDFSLLEWREIKMIFQPSVWVAATTDNNMLYLMDLLFGCVQTFNIDTRKWRCKRISANLSLVEYCFAAVGGFLYIIGGYDREKDEWVSTMKRYKVSDGSWADMAPLPNAKICRSSTVIDNKIVISDGSRVDEYFIDTDRWRSLSRLKYYAQTDGNFNVCKIVI